MAALYSGTADEWCHLGNAAPLKSSLEVDFNIDSFEEHMNKEGDLECLKSHEFTVNGKTMNIDVWPNGSIEESRGFVSIFLCSDNKPDVEVSCIFRVGTIQLEFGFRRINPDPDKPDWGYKKFMSHDKCKLELKNGMLQLKVKLIAREKTKNTLIIGRGKRISNDCPQKSISSQIFEERSFTDFEIISDEKSYLCHKVFLSAASPVFKRMIESEMKEALESKLVLESLPEDVMNSFLKFIYTGEMDEKVMNENCVIFLELGEKYDIGDLKNVAEQAMIANLNHQNMISFFKAGQLFRGESIRASAKTFISQNINSVKDKQKLKTELHGQSDLLLELLESLVGI